MSTVYALVGGGASFKINTTLYKNVHALSDHFIFMGIPKGHETI